jgi:hypothetical protein
VAWEDIGTLSNVAMAVAAVGALIYAHLQIKEGRRSELQADASELWREILRLGFENPQISDPTLKLAEFDYDNLTIDGSKDMFQKYELFVDTILSASEEILDVRPTDEWNCAVRIQLRHHHAYLMSEHFQGSGNLEQFTPKFRAVLEMTLANMAKPHPDTTALT